MGYLDVYKARVEHLGATPQERAFQSGILEFRRYLKYNQHTVFNLKNGRFPDDSFSGVILTDKEDENRVSQILLVELGIDIVPGDLIYWNDEPWLVYRSTTSSYQPHQKFYMVKCNYNIGWVNKEEEKIQNSWVYLLGSKDSKIKDNFRTWNNLITPQPNKYIELILPYTDMKLGTEIVIIDETWYLVDFDKNSVPGVIFMSFTETNFNEQRDGEVAGQMIANKDTLPKWRIDLPSHRHVKPGDKFTATYSITKNGKEVSVTPKITVSSPLSITEDNIITAGNSGSGVITISYEGAKATQIVAIKDTSDEIPIIRGSDKIRATEKAEYKINFPEEIKFVLVNPEDSLQIAELIESEQPFNTCIIDTEKYNGRVGTVKLKAYIKTEFEGETSPSEIITKTIQVIPFWQVI